MNIGEIISAFDVLQQQVTSPVQQLRKEIDLMHFELSIFVFITIEQPKLIRNIRV